MRTTRTERLRRLPTALVCALAVAVACREPSAPAGVPAEPSAAAARRLVWSLDLREPREGAGRDDLAERMRRGRELRAAWTDESTTDAALRSARFDALHGDLDAAARTLRSALERAPEDGELWADLGASMLAGAASSSRPQDVRLAALDALERAGEAGGAPCNEAVLLADLGLSQVALRRAARCGAPGEALVRSRFAAARRVAAGPRTTEAWGEPIDADDLGRRLAAEVERLEADSRPGAEAWRAALELRSAESALALRELGGSLTAATVLDLATRYARRTGNSQVARLAEEIARAPLDAEALQMLAAWREAAARIRDFEPDRARQLLLRAHEIAERRGSALLPSIRLELAAADYLAGRLADRAAMLADLRARYPRDDFPAVWARALWMETLIRQGEGDWEGALSPLRQSRELFERLLESARAAWLTALEGISLRRLGRHEEAADRFVVAIGGLAQAGDTRALSGALILFAEQQLERGHGRAAIVLLEEAAAWDRLEGSPVLVADSLSTLATALVRNGRASEAVERLREAAAVLAAFDDAGGRARVEAIRAFAEAAALIDEDPPLAVRRASALLDRFEALGEIHFRIDGLRLRGRALRASGESAAAERDFAAALDEAARQFASVPSSREAARFLDLGRAALEDLVAVTVTAPDGPLRALARLESMRRLQFDRTATPPEELERRLVATRPREGVCLSTQLVTGSALHLWSRCGAASWVHEELPIDGERLRFDAASYATERSELSAETLLARGEAFAVLLPAGVRNCGPSSVQWIVAADEPLSPILWSWLPDPCGGGPLGERVAIGTTPALSLLDARPVTGETGRLDLLALAAGASLEVGGLALPKLRNVGAEATAASRASGGGAVLTDSEITAEAVARRLPAADALHLAGHFFRRSLGPATVPVFLVDGDPDAGGWTPERLLERGAKRLRFAFLSGCGSGEGPRRAVAGSEDFAAELLAGGIREVVATRWDVPDLDYAKFVSSFYSHYAGGSSAVEALWSARRAARGFAGDDPAARALRAFEVVTSYFEEEQGK